MKDPVNILGLLNLAPDFIGFIFYAKSKRFVDQINDGVINAIPKHIKKVGVFVNSTFEEIKDKVTTYGLDFVQLHGDESPQLCEQLKEEGVGVIKVFSVDSDFDFEILEPYKPYSDYFLFDTKGKDYGGNGVTFDWSVLKKYDNEKPFFISGGLSPENIDEVEGLSEMNLAAVDLNSCFEDAPGLKNLNMLRSIDFDRVRHKLVR